MLLAIKCLCISVVANLFVSHSQATVCSSGVSATMSDVFDNLNQCCETTIREDVEKHAEGNKLVTEGWNCTVSAAPGSGCAQPNALGYCGFEKAALNEFMEPSKRIYCCYKRCGGSGECVDGTCGTNSCGQPKRKKSQRNRRPVGLSLLGDEEEQEER